jgi:hypothetical protein
MSTNHLPVIRDRSQGMWRRVKLIPWEATIDDAERDRYLPDKLWVEREGILAWAVQGHMEWLAHGLGEPEVVKKAIAEYRTSQDVVAAFISDCCLTGEGYEVWSTDLYLAFQEWCDKNGEKMLSQSALGQQLAELKYENARGAGGRRKWKGIGLLVPSAKYNKDPQGAEATSTTPGDQADSDASDTSDANAPIDELFEGSPDNHPCKNPRKTANQRQSVTSVTEDSPADVEKTILKLLGYLENILRGRRLAPPEQVAGYHKQVAELRRQIRELGAELVEPPMRAVSPQNPDPPLWMLSPDDPVLVVGTYPRDFPSLEELVGAGSVVVAVGQDHQPRLPGEVLAVSGFGVKGTAGSLRKPGW